MPAILKPVGLLKTYLDGKSEIAVPAGQSVQEALDSLCLPGQLVALVLVGDQPQPKDYRLREGDIVRLLAVIGGG